MSALRYFAVGALLVFLAGCASMPDPAGGQTGAFVPTAPAAAVARAPTEGGASTAAGDYHLSPGDLLDVTVFQVPDLNRKVQVDGAGNISLPLIGEVKAAGETVDSLQKKIAQKLGAKYLQSPQVSVFLKTAAGEQVTVTGAVSKPGVYPIIGQMTLVQALAESGGLKAVGDPNEILVYRQEKGQRMVARFNVDDIRGGKATDPELYAGDMVVAGSSGVRSAWQSLTKALPVAGVFSTSVYYATRF